MPGAGWLEGAPACTAQGEGQGAPVRPEGLPISEATQELRFELAVARVVHDPVRDREQRRCPRLQLGRAPPELVQAVGVRLHRRIILSRGELEQNRAMVGREHDLPQSLLPLPLAVALVRSRVAGAAGADPDAVATLIASSAPVFEYWMRVEDLDCVVEMLRHPERAVFIRNRVLRTNARKLVSRSRELGARSAELRGAAEKALAKASLVSQPAWPGAAPSP